MLLTERYAEQINGSDHLREPMLFPPVIHPKLHSIRHLYTIMREINSGIIGPAKTRDRNLEKKLIHWMACVNSGTIGRKVEKLLVNFTKVQTSTQPEES